MCKALLLWVTEIRQCYFGISDYKSLIVDVNGAIGKSFF